MDKPITFGVLFPAAEPVHAGKDVGLIPLLMHGWFGYRSQLFCRRSAGFSSDFKKGVQVIQLPAGRSRKLRFSLIRWLLRNARSLDVLNLYHLDAVSLIYARVYKMINRKGIVYLKTDLNLDLFIKRFKQRTLKAALRKLVIAGNVSALDIVSTELNSAMPPLSKLLDPGTRLLWLPNGPDEAVAQKVHLKSFEQKENMILIVGRIGSFPKNSQMLFDALGRVDLKDWTVTIAGEVDSRFEPWLAGFLGQLSPEQRARIIFTGRIDDKEPLYDYYNGAKIFCLTSDFEGFPMVFGEALYFGNYLVSTKVAAARELVSDVGGRLVDFDDHMGLAEVIQELIDDPSEISLTFDERMRKSEKYRWSARLPELDSAVRSKLKLQ